MVSRLGVGHMISQHRAFGGTGERGATALTYGLVVGLVALAGLAAVTRIGSSVDTLFSSTAETMTQGLETGPSPSDSPASPGARVSCKAILDAGESTGDGSYQIDPDGAGGEDPFSVTCDMTTDGGGWTRLSGQLVLDHFTSSFGGYFQNNGSCARAEWQGDALFFGEATLCNEDIAAYVDINLGFTWREFYFDGFTSVETASPNGTWDMGPRGSGSSAVSLGWGGTNSSGWGDVGFGTADNAAPTVSYWSANSSSQSTNGQTFNFDANIDAGTRLPRYDTGTPSTVFRIGATQTGGDDGEATLVWTAGYIFVR